MLIESGPDFSDILEISAIDLGQVQRAKARLPIAFPLGVTNDRALDGLPCLDFQPRIASLSGLVGAVALFGQNAFETHLFHGLEERRSFFNNSTHAIRSVFSNRILKPLASPYQRLIDDR